MNIQIIQQRLEKYQCKTPIEEENALKEISQEIALMALSRTGFFNEVEFHGGTALRILYGLPRFFEDMDFALLKPNRDFKLLDFLKNVTQTFQSYGYNIEIQDRTKGNNTVQKAFLKDDSIGKFLSLQYPQQRNTQKKIRIKIEVDINPPLGVTTEIKYLDFPLSFSVQIKDPPSSFVGKIHALLCRKYIKGRDWYDFIWYVSQNTQLNYTLLTNAIDQIGPWEKQKIDIHKDWILTQLEQKILSIDWQKASQDVIRFLRLEDQQTLNLWSTDFFLSRLEKLESYLHDR